MSSTKKLKEVLKDGANRYSAVRLDARTRNKYAKKCEKCGYDKHVEVCHIKPIHSFDLETSLEVINDKNNLIILCPNCHWEFDNKEKTDKRICPACGGNKWRNATQCRQCSNKNKLHIRAKHVVWPTKEELSILVNELPLQTIGKKYGVTGNAVKKWCKFYDIALGNRLGFWAKKRCKASISLK